MNITSINLPNSSIGTVAFIAEVEICMLESSKQPCWAYKCKPCSSRNLLFLIPNILGILMWQKKVALRLPLHCLHADGFSIAETKKRTKV